MPDPFTPIYEAASKALLGSLLCSSVLSPPPMAHPTPVIVPQPRRDKMTEYLLAAPSWENPCFDQAAAISILKLASPNAQQQANLQEFRELVKAWKSDRRSTSSSMAMAMHPAYQKIIGMGKPALPFILSELHRELDHWFWALAAIAHENPVPPESRGKMQEMAKAWLDWGRAKGYV